MEEIERCQHTQLKPNFIVLFGDRYGWRPAPYEIRTALFDEQAEEMPNVRTSDGFILLWNSEAIVALLRETALAQTFYETRGMKRPEAERIA